MKLQRVTVIGGGLAGSECAWQLARRGVPVTLREMKPQRREVMLIDAALRRMDTGVFGTCVDCGYDIPIERLEALPFAIRCEEDATRHELEMRGGPQVTPSI